MVIAELGVYRGEFSQELLSVNTYHLYLVDIWTGATSSADKDGKNNSQEWDMFNVYLNILLTFDCDVSTVIRGRSADFLTRIADDYLDCVYIDSEK